MIDEQTFSGYLGTQFQMKLMWQILTQPEFASKLIPMLSVNYFDDAPTKQFFVAIKNYHDEFGKVANLQNGSVHHAIKKYGAKGDPTQEEILTSIVDKIRMWNDKMLNDPQLYDGDVVQKATYTFITQQEYRKLADFIHSEIRQGNTGKSSDILFEIDQKIKFISEIGDEEDYGTEVFDNIQRALQKEFRNPIPTGILGIDTLTGGGLGRGEMGIVLAASGVGKSTILTKFANEAQLMEKNVLQIVFEDTVDQIRRKHFAIWSKVSLQDMDNNTELVEEKIIEYHENDKKLGKLIIKRFSQENTTIPKIRAWMERYQKKFNIKFDILILDYIDCVEPHNKSVDITSGEIGVIKAFESMAADYNIPCWTAIQTNRTGFDAEYISASQMGGSIKRAQKTHFLMFVAKNNEQKLSGRANIGILKARFAQDGQIFNDAIFNNNTLEIVISDTASYTMGKNTNTHTPTMEVDEETVESFNKNVKETMEKIHKEDVTNNPKDAEKDLNEIFNIDNIQKKLGGI